MTIGVDEAGRGPLAGAVYAAAVVLGTEQIEGLADSKRLSAGQRERLAREIRVHARAWAVALATPEEIDRHNILQASLLAMRRAVEALACQGALVLVDGNRTIPGLALPQRAIVKGDATVAEISAASILAKTARDEAMLVAEQRYPGYGFAGHKGYPTPEHLEALARLGPSPIHRQSFGPVAAVVSEAGFLPFALSPAPRGPSTRLRPRLPLRPADRILSGVCAGVWQPFRGVSVGITNIEVAQAATLRPIQEIAEESGLLPEEIIPYGRDKAKVELSALKRLADRPDGDLVLVTAMTPTKSGEGKSTITVGLTQALRRAGRKSVACLREASLGPCLGMKGGACGGGYSQVLPMEDINLHFTGDIHAVTSAHNALAALLDSHLHFGNDLGLDLRRITWPRVMDMCDRALRDIVIGLGGVNGGVPRESLFRITAASEVMAILCLASGLGDLKERLGNIVVGSRRDKSLVRARELSAHGAMALLLKDAVKPNLVQTVEGGPAFVHGGPFANIAHGCNSVTATRTALKLGDIVVTEAGFASDLGAEKFFNIKCRQAGLTPKVGVIAATLKAVKRAGGGDEKNLHAPDTDAVRGGIANIEAHVENVRQHGLPAVVAVNRFAQDSDEELALLRDLLAERGIACEICDAYSEGGAGCAGLAERVLELLAAGESRFTPLYPNEMPLAGKIETIATRVYGADGVDFLPAARSALELYQASGLGELPICMAKTQYSLSDVESRVGRPKGFRIAVRDAYASAGAGFIVALTGEMMTMPGLVKTPAAVSMDIADDGTISGLF